MAGAQLMRPMTGPIVWGSFAAMPVAGEASRREGISPMAVTRAVRNDGGIALIDEAGPTTAGRKRANPALDRLMVAVILTAFDDLARHARSHAAGRVPEHAEIVGFFCVDAPTESRHGWTLDDLCAALGADIDAVREKAREIVRRVLAGARYKRPHARTGLLSKCAESTERAA